MERWLTTLDTKEAAAFATLGATVQIQSSILQRTSTREVRFLVSHTTADGLYQIGKLRLALQDRSLPRASPAHPLLTILRAYMNREATLDIQHKGSRYRLSSVAGAPGVHQYTASDSGLPGLAGVPAIVRTQDLKISAALATAGFPLLHLTGSAGRHEYSHAAFPAPGTPPGLPHAAALIQTWRENPESLPAALPFVLAMRGLTIREQLRTEVSKAIDTILISKAGSAAHAVIRSDANDKAWDKARAFFIGIS